MRWSKRSRLERSLDCLKPGTVNWSNDGGSVFLIMFNTGQALLLPGGRFSWPRIGRGGVAERLRNMHCSWPQTRIGHGHDLVQCRTRTQSVRVRIQSAAAFCPRQRSGARTVHIHGQATASIVHERTTAADLICPHPVRDHDRDLSVSAHSPCSRPVRNYVLSVHSLETRTVFILVQSAAAFTVNSCPSVIIN
jgi:hypothetical protein